MEGTLGAFWTLSSIVLLLLVNGFFTAAEIALLLSQAGKIDGETGNRRVTRFSEILIQSIDRSILVTQLSASLATILYAVSALNLFHAFFTPLLETLGEPWQQPTSLGLALLLTLLLHVVIAELIAKAVAIRFPEQTLRFTAPVLYVLRNLLSPLLTICRAAVNLPLKPFDAKLPKEMERARTADELSRLVSQGTETGVFDKDEEEMLRGVFGFSQTVAREVMTPRTDLVTIQEDAGLDEVISTVLQSGFSRFPVRGAAVDDIHGILLVKDLLPVFAQYQQSKESFKLTDVMRPAYFIPDTKSIDDLLNEFKRRKIHMAIVVDEHGGVDGLVTLEDLIEEIVGDIFDESDTPERDIVVEPNGDVLADGGTSVCELNERFQFGIPEGDYDTIAGFIFTSLGRLPKNQDRVVINSSGVILIGHPGRDGIGEVSVNGTGRFAVPQDEEEGQGHRQEVLIIVEKTDHQRVESVRIKLRQLDQESESDDSLVASEA